MISPKQKRRQRIRFRIRKKISGTSVRPRLSVYKSNYATYVQLVDDTRGHTLLGIRWKGKNIEAAKTGGVAIAKAALDKGIGQVVFDRSGYHYSGGVITALSQAVKETGLKH